MTIKFLISIIEFLAFSLVREPLTGYQQITLLFAFLVSRAAAFKCSRREAYVLFKNMVEKFSNN